MVDVPGTDIFLSLLDWAKEDSRGPPYSEAWQQTRRRRTSEKAKLSDTLVEASFLPQEFPEEP